MSGDLHEYFVTCAWHGSTGTGYDSYDRAHRGHATPAEAMLDLSSDPAFRGDPHLLNPEQLVVLAASSCQLLSFLAVAARARIDVVDYLDDAYGVMPDVPKPMRILRIDLRPRITVRGDVKEDRLRHLCDVAHDECFIANSLSTEITVTPTLLLID
jgi:organic hydroperoxide reductase OsmC/OhrA